MTHSAFLTPVFVAVLCVIAVLVLLSLLYGVFSHRFTDKIVAANMIGSLTINIVVILAVFLGADYILDIGLVYALLSFLAVIVLCRVVTDHIFGQLRHMRDNRSEELTRGEISNAGAEKSAVADRVDEQRRKAARRAKKEDK